MSKEINSNCWDCKNGYVTERRYGYVVACGEYNFDYEFPVVK